MPERERVKLSLGKTYNLGSYESMRLDVGIEADVPGSTNLTNTFNFCMLWAAERLKELEKEHNLPRKGK